MLVVPRRQKQKAGLRLDAFDSMMKGGESGPVVVPGSPDDSPLIEAVRYNGSTQMPPKGKLTEPEIAALTEWVKTGAIWPDRRTGPEAVGARREARDHGRGPRVLVVPPGPGSRRCPR